MNRRLFHHFSNIRSRFSIQPRYTSTDILLAGGAVGAFLAWFAIIFTFWYYGYAHDRSVNYPDPYRFSVDKNLFIIRDTYKAVQTAAESSYADIRIKDSTTRPYWWDVWDEGLATAAKEHKPVVVYFMRYSFHWTMENLFYIPKIRQQLAHDWVCIRIDIDPGYPTITFDGRRMTTRGLAHYFHGDEIPAFLFIDARGKPVQTVPGFMGKDVFGSLLDFMKNEVYAKKIPFEEYRKTQSSSGR